MRNICLLIILMIFISCSSDKGHGELVDLSVTTLSIQKDPFLEGTWGMTNYFDSIIKYKEINKFRLQQPTWFAVLIEIKEDSLYTYGSIDETVAMLDFSTDTICKLDTWVGDSSNNVYWIVKSDSFLQLISNNYSDSIVYSFRKRPDLSALIDHSLKRNKASDGVRDYFNQELLSGTYNQYFSSKKMSFRKNGDVSNWVKYNKFKIDNYFGTYHPYNGLDVVFLYNTTKKIKDTYSWEFQNDSLILTELIEDSVFDNGTYHQTDSWIESNNIQILLKTKKY